MSGVHREVAGHGSGVRGARDARAGRGLVTSAKIIGAELLMAQCEDREWRRAKRRVRAARFPAHASVTGWASANWRPGGNLVAARDRACVDRCMSNENVRQIVWGSNRGFGR